MDRVINIADALLSAVKDKYHDDYSDISEIKKYWHNAAYLFFTEVNYRRLFHSKENGIAEMRDAGLAPQYLYDFYCENKLILDKRIDEALESYYESSVDINDCRQLLLNIEIDFTGSEPLIVFDKKSRDNTGSYYTPKDLAMVIIREVFADFEIENGKEYKIADFSCGGGDFFLAILDYVHEAYRVEYNTIAKWFYGIDVDPIALQICIVNLLLYVDSDDWKEILDHFTLGNPLIIYDGKTSIEKKNELFSLQRIYAPEFGLPASFLETKYDIVIGNPPWEKIRFEERKFFRGIDDRISSIAQKAERDAEIKKLEDTWPKVYGWRSALYSDYANMTASKYRHGKITESVSGELNTYSLFTELGYNMLSEKGVMSLIVKSTLFTAPLHKNLWSMLLADKAVKTVLFFENTNRIFNIDSRERFAVFVVSKEKTPEFDFCAGLVDAQMMQTAERISLSEGDLIKINPITRTIPNVRNNNEIAFLKEVHSRFRLFADVYSDCHFGRLIHLTAHSALIDKEAAPDNIPIYEGKFIEQYDARYATFKGMPESKKYAGKASAVRLECNADGSRELPESRFFVKQSLWDKYRLQYDKDYSLCWRSLTSPTNRRTMLAMILPTCPTCQSIQMLQTPDNADLVMLLALFNSIPFDYLVRIKMPGLDLTQSVIKQIPVPSEADYSQEIIFNNIKASLKEHILSYAVSILEDEKLCADLTDSLKKDVYKVEGISKAEKQKMIDLLFKEAYHLSAESYNDILTTFPKYQADRTA